MGVSFCFFSFVCSVNIWLCGLVLVNLRMCVVMLCVLMLLMLSILLSVGSVVGICMCDSVWLLMMGRYGEWL